MNNENVVRAELGKALHRAATFVRGLDEILEGGLPRYRTTLIKGAAGSGKTMLALEFLYRGVLNGEPGIFVGFERPLLSEELIKKYCLPKGTD